MIQKWLNLVLDFFLPKAPAVEKLERMGAAGFAGRAKRSRELNSLSANRRSRENLIAFFDYHDPLVRTAIWELKFRGNRAVAALLAECLFDELSAELSELEIFENFTRPLIVPVPLSSKRRRERGFNQCEILLDELAKLDTNKIFEINKNILIKIRDTSSQTKTDSRASRLKNLRGAFAANENGAARHRNIIVIDDVTTTGTTLSEAMKTLRRAGAKKILGIALAH
ncbi:MAG: phosphoribosyltransferase family protein [Candidatus Paceibacterota bacterium]|jgi:ComF family protein